MNSVNRAAGLKALKLLGSVGPKMAVKIYELGYHSVASLNGADPYEMYLRYSEKVGGYADPCVEDVFRCAVAQATFPQLEESLKNWWVWGVQRGQASVELL